MKKIFSLFLLSLSVLLGGCEEMMKEFSKNNSTPIIQPAPNNSRTNSNPSTDPNANNRPNNRDTPNPDPAQNLRPGRAETLTYKGHPVLLTQHAKCRMGCRQIEEAEIGEVIAQNNINLRKSTPEPTDGKCPTFAYEGKTKDNQQVRVIVADCDREAKIVTVIDLKNDFTCTCD